MQQVESFANVFAGATFFYGETRAEKYSRSKHASTGHFRRSSPAATAAISSDPAKKVFGEVGGASDPRAFRKAELPLLCAFCEAVCLNRYYGRVLAEETTDDSSFPIALGLRAQIDRDTGDAIEMDAALAA